MYFTIEISLNLIKVNAECEYFDFKVNKILLSNKDKRLKLLSADRNLWLRIKGSKRF